MKNHSIANCLITINYCTKCDYLPPYCSLCFSRAITSVIAREKQREQLGGGAIADGGTRAKNASGNGPYE
jgi:hypothetical protein